jgi:uncharacterized membrane protein YedE/YeeE
MEAVYSPIEVVNWMLVIFIIGLIGGAILSGGWKFKRNKKTLEKEQ